MKLLPPTSAVEVIELVSSVYALKAKQFEIRTQNLASGGGEAKVMKPMADQQPANEEPVLLIYMSFGYNDLSNVPRNPV